MLNVESAWAEILNVEVFKYRAEILRRKHYYKKFVSFLSNKYVMETTIRINTDMLTADIVEGIKKMFPHKTVDIIIQSADDTDYILSNPAFSQELQERITEYEIKKKVIAVKPDELL